jgi:hypothetical protein
MRSQTADQLSEKNEFFFIIKMLLQKVFKIKKKNQSSGILTHELIYLIHDSSIRGDLS